jgi:hypothetical protein
LHALHNGTQIKAQLNCIGIDKGYGCFGIPHDDPTD